MLTPDFESFINRSQVLALRLRDVSAPVYAHELRLLIGSSPRPLRRSDEAIVIDILERMVAHFVRAAGLEHRGDVAARFLDLTLVRHRYAEWQDECGHLVEFCLARLPASAATMRAPDARVHRMIQLIEVEYADASLELQRVAAAVDLSYWHAARLLKQHTGAGFVAHVRERRVAAAQRLLLESTLSMKEISALVGYTHASQFTREFRSACGVAPRVFRQRHVSGVPSA